MQRRFRGFLLLGGVAAAVSAAAVLGNVDRGDAAGINICPGASCLTTAVSPHVTSAAPADGFAALAAGLFDNTTTATATHLSLTFSFKDVTSNPDPNTAPAAVVRIDTAKIQTFRDGASFAASCTTSPAGSGLVDASSVTCSFGNLAGGHSAKLRLPFTPVTPNAPGTRVAAQLLATYGEGNGGPNDTQAKADALTIGASNAAGQCTAGGSQIQAVGDTTTHIGITYPGATDLPCTPVGIGVDPTPVTVGGVTGEQAFVELPILTGFATAVHDLTPLPPHTNVNNIVFWEGTTDFSAPLHVPDCDAQGLPPSPPSAGFSGDTCVFSRNPLPKGGGSFVFHILGVLLFDPRYTP